MQDKRQRKAYVSMRKGDGAKFPQIMREMHPRAKKANGGAVSRVEMMRRAMQSEDPITQAYDAYKSGAGSRGLGDPSQYMDRRPSSMRQVDDPSMYLDRMPSRPMKGDPKSFLQPMADGGEVDRRRQKIAAYTSRGLEPPAELMESTNRMTSPERQRVEEEAVFDIGSNAAMLAAPVARPLAAVGRAIAANPAKTLGLGAIGGATVGAAEAGGESPYDRQMMELSRQEASEAARIRDLESEYNRLISERTNEEQGARGGKAGRGPQWNLKNNAVLDWERANKSALDDARARRAAIEGRMKAFEAENSPAAIRERQAKAPIKEAFPLETGMAQIGLIGLGAASALALKGRHLSSYNSTLKALDAARNSAVASAQGARAAGDAIGAARYTDEAIRLSDEIAAKMAKGPDKYGTVAPAIAGWELAALGPTAVDKLRSSGPDDPRSQAFSDMMSGGQYFPGQNLAERGLGALALGYGTAKIPGMAMEAARGRYSPASSAATDALAAEARGELSGMAKGFADTAVNAAKQDARIIAANDRRAGLSETAAENRDSAVLRRALTAARAQAERDVAQSLAKLTPAERASMRSRQLDLSQTPPVPPQRQLPPPAAPTNSPKQALPPPSNPTPSVPSNAASVNIDSGAITKALGKVDPAVMSRMVADPAVAQAKIKSLISMQTGKAPKDISQAEIDSGMAAFKSMTGRKDGGTVGRCRSMTNDGEVMDKAMRAARKCGGRVKKADGGLVDHWSWHQPRDNAGRWR